MLAHGDPVPDATIWTGALDEPLPLRDVLAGVGSALVCFYPFDWSPT